MARKLPARERRTHPIYVRMTEAQHDEAIVAARRAGFPSVAEWIRTLVKKETVTLDTR